MFFESGGVLRERIVRSRTWCGLHPQTVRERPGPQAASLGRRKAPRRVGGKVQRDGSSTHALLSGLDEVGGGLVPAEGAGAGDHERLAGLLSVEDLAEHTQAVAENGDERGRDVRDRGGGVGVEDLMLSAAVTSFGGSPQHPADPMHVHGGHGHPAQRLKTSGCGRRRQRCRKLVGRSGETATPHLPHSPVDHNS